MIEAHVVRTVEAQPYALVFATVSGAHLYGFPSTDSDWDIRGSHVLPLSQVIGLNTPRETIEVSGRMDGIDIDLVTHDVKKFMSLMLRRNGYVLEQIYSPLVVRTSPAHAELKDLAKGCITRHHARHYLGFATSQWELCTKGESRRIKPLLYTYRVLLTGIWLMRTGEVEANLVRLAEESRLSHVTELIDRKRQGGEQCQCDQGELAFHEGEVRRLTAELEAAAHASRLPDRPTTRPGLDDLLKRLRMGQGT